MRIFGREGAGDSRGMALRAVAMWLFCEVMMRLPGDHIPKSGKQRESALVAAGHWISPKAFSKTFCPEKYAAKLIIPKYLGGPIHPCNYMCTPTAMRNMNATFDLVGAPIASIYGVPAYGAALACTVAWGGIRVKTNSKQGSNASLARIKQKKSTYEFRKMSDQNARDLLADLCSVLAQSACDILQDAYHIELEKRPHHKVWVKEQGFRAYLFEKFQLQEKQLDWADESSLRSHVLEQARQHPSFERLQALWQQAGCGNTTKKKNKCSYRQLALQLCIERGDCSRTSDSGGKIYRVKFYRVTVGGKFMSTNVTLQTEGQCKETNKPTQMQTMQQ